MAVVHDETYEVVAKTRITAQVESPTLYTVVIGWISGIDQFHAWLATRPDVDTYIYTGSTSAYGRFARSHNRPRTQCFCWCNNLVQPCLGYDYSNERPYMLHLLVPDNTLQWSKTSIFYGVGVPSPLPVSAFHADVFSGYAPLTVEFTDDSTNSPTSWLWDFGDGLLSSDQHPTHVYNSPGVYTVDLTVWNASGHNTLTKIDYISVVEPPPLVYPIWKLQIGPL